MKFLKRVWNFVRPKKHYKYKLGKDGYKLKHSALDGITFNNKWVTIANGYMYIRAGYAWDGCSPKIKIAGIVVGIPDGPNDECKYPSLVHDIFCQFINEISVSKITVLRIFKDMLYRADWCLAEEYVAAVDKFGPQGFLKG